VALFGGVPLNAFLLIVLGGSFAVVAQMYWFLPSAVILWWLAKWATRRDPMWMDLLQLYVYEKDVYDSLPRNTVWNSRPKGWGKGIPW
jgi:type IV secretory pathway VirB3-like protein